MGAPVPWGLALRPDPGRQANVCIVVVAVFLIICIINFVYPYFSVNSLFCLILKCTFSLDWVNDGKRGHGGCGQFRLSPGVQH